jgi:hypothetical protein
VVTGTLAWLACSRASFARAPGSTSVSPRTQRAARPRRTSASMRPQTRGGPCGGRTFWSHPRAWCWATSPALSYGVDHGYPSWGPVVAKLAMAGWVVAHLQGSSGGSWRGGTGAHPRRVLGDALRLRALAALGHHRLLLGTAGIARVAGPGFVSRDQMFGFHGRRKTAAPCARPSIKVSSGTCRRCRHHLANNPRHLGVVRRSKAA